MSGIAPPAATRLALRPAIGLAALAFVLALYVAHAWYYRGYVNDDAYITFRYSRNLAAGGGPYFNPGERVEGYTNFLLMLIVSGAIRLAGPDAALPTARALNVAGGIVALAAAWALCGLWLRRMTHVRRHALLLAAAAPLLVAANPAFALNSMSGLETTLFAGCITLGTCLLESRGQTMRQWGSGAAFALAALTRPEGAALAAAALVGCLPRLRRGNGRQTIQPHRRLSTAFRMEPAGAGLVVVLAIAAQLAFRVLAYDGSWLPNTFWAKAGGADFSSPPAQYAWDFARVHLGGLAALAAALPLLAGAPRLRRSVLPATAVCAAGLALLGLLGSDWMLGFRSLVPYTPLWAALAVAGVAVATARLPRYRRTIAVLGVIALLVVVGPQAQVRRDYRTVSEESSEGYRVAHLALAGRLQEQAKPGQTVALMDIGLIGFTCPQLRILDVTGLTDRHIARAPGPFLRKEYDPAYILDQRPDFIVLVITERPTAEGDTGLLPLTIMEQNLARDPAFQADYQRLRAPAGESSLDQLACLLGAERLYRHTQRQLYLLALFSRQR